MNGPMELLDDLINLFPDVSRQQVLELVFAVEVKLAGENAHLKQRVNDLLELNNQEMERRREAEGRAKELAEKLLRCAPLQDRETFMVTNDDVRCDFCGEERRYHEGGDVMFAAGLYANICLPCVELLKIIFDQENSREKGREGPSVD